MIAMSEKKERRAAPHNLDLVADFVNSADLETGREDLSGPRELAAWLHARDLLPSGTALGEADLDASLRLREALRAVMLTHNGGPMDATAERELEAVARRGRLSVHFPAGDAMRLGPEAPGLPGALAALLIPVAEAISDGTCSRVKACRADDCHWAFYDFSRNRSGAWCEMAVCGNREKVRAYRERAPRKVSGRPA
jgi:predicted RNA-binding Zn ribbon-like protein